MTLIRRSLCSIMWFSFWFCWLENRCSGLSYYDVGRGDNESLILMNVFEFESLLFFLADAILILCLFSEI